MSGRLHLRLRASASAIATVTANRNLRRALVSFASAWTAELTFTVALGVVAFRDGGTTTVGLVVFARMLSAAVLAPWGAALADRFRRERVLRWSCVVRATLLAAAAATLALDGPAVAVYVLSVAATGAFATYRPSHSALLPLLCVTPLELTSAYVARGFIAAVGALVGPVVAAVLLGLAEPASAFVVAAALALWSGWSLVGIRYEAPIIPSGAAGRMTFAEVVMGARALARYPEGRLLAALGAVQTFTRGCLSVLVLVLAIDLLDGGDAEVGILSAAVGVGAVGGVVGIAVMKGQRGLATLLGIGVVLWAVPLALMGAAPRMVVVLVGMVVIGIGDALVDVGLFTLPARLVPDDVLARWFGALESVIAVSVAIGALVVTPLIAGLGARWTLVVVGLLGPTLRAGVMARRCAGSTPRCTCATTPSTRCGAWRCSDRCRCRPSKPSPRGRSVRRCRPGQVVFEQGDHGDRFYVIEAGTAVVQQDGREIAMLGPADGFGEIALLHDVARTATVRAATDLTVRSIDRPHFLMTVNGYASSATVASTRCRRPPRPRRTDALTTWIQAGPGQAGGGGFGKRSAGQPAPAGSWRASGGRPGRAPSMAVRVRHRIAASVTGPRRSTYSSSSATWRCLSR